jgi:L-lysine 2,3-aminomutase
LFDAHILPYYLHQLDKVSGAAHFAVSDQMAIELIAILRRQLPGYLLPRLVREQAGEPSKLPLF